MQAQSIYTATNTQSHPYRARFPTIGLMSPGSNTIHTLILNLTYSNYTLNLTYSNYTFNWAHTKRLEPKQPSCCLNSSCYPFSGILTAASLSYDCTVPNMFLQCKDYHRCSQGTNKQSSWRRHTDTHNHALNKNDTNLVCLRTRVYQQSLWPFLRFVKRNILKNNINI